MGEGFFHIAIESESIVDWFDIFLLLNILLIIASFLLLEHFCVVLSGGDYF
jgi:hypothetical protein